MCMMYDMYVCTHTYIHVCKMYTYRYIYVQYTDTQVPDDITSLAHPIYLAAAPVKGGRRQLVNICSLFNHLGFKK